MVKLLPCIDSNKMKSVLKNTFSSSLVFVYTNYDVHMSTKETEGLHPNIRDNVMRNYSDKYDKVHSYPCSYFVSTTLINSLLRKADTIEYSIILHQIDVMSGSTIWFVRNWFLRHAIPN